jgi:hypothetical protein
MGALNPDNAIAGTSIGLMMISEKTVGYFLLVMWLITDQPSR